jgi:hypothetical protein
VCVEAKFGGVVKGAAARVKNATSQGGTGKGWHWALEFRSGSDVSFLSWSPENPDKRQGQLNLTKTGHKDLEYVKGKHIWQTDNHDAKIKEYRMGRTSFTDAELVSMCKGWTAGGSWSFGGGRNCGDFVKWLASKTCIECQEDPRHFWEK